jgi:virulence-associated protein VagC
MPFSGSRAGSGGEIRIRRHGNPVTILEPSVDDWSWLQAIVSKPDNDFVEAVKEQPEPQKRPCDESLEMRHLRDANLGPQAGVSGARSPTM